MSKIECAYVWGEDFEFDDSKMGKFFALVHTAVQLHSIVKGTDGPCGKKAKYVIDGVGLCDEHAREKRGW